MLAMRPMVGADFLKYVSISLFHEPPAQIPMLYSKSLYLEAIPIGLRDWIHSKAIVRSLRRDADGTWLVVAEASDLVPARGIVVGFQGYPHQEVFHLSELESFEEESQGHWRFSMRLPDEPPSQERFDIWVSQSVNLAASAIVGRVTSEMVNAATAGSMLLTDSPFVSELLKLELGTGDEHQEQLATLALDLDLPVLSSVSIQNLMDLRSEHGDSLAIFRRVLNGKLREIRLEPEEARRRQKLEHLRHELTDRVADVQLELDRFKRGLVRDAVIGTASLTAILSGGNSLLAGLLGAAAIALNQRDSHLSKLKEHPLYFLWKLHQEAERK
jgi:hypothetical protein